MDEAIEGCPMEETLRSKLKIEAERIGFDAVGFARADPPSSFPAFMSWIDSGHHAGMDYLAKLSGARGHPSSILAGVKTVVMLSMVYGRRDNDPTGPTQGKVARYARGLDYHRGLWDRLDKLLGWVKQEVPNAQGRGVCDTAPLLERDFASRAGLGWIGKNTMLIDRNLGSFTVIAALLLDVEIEPDPPHARNHCGTCTRCLDACPTDAFASPYVLNANKCISYWTIEHKGMIANDMADRLDGWVFGCDICQDVCPWNRKAPEGRNPDLEPSGALTNPDLIAWLETPDPEFAVKLRGTALKRANRAGLIRNAALILGSRGISEAVPALANLLNDPDPTIREATGWALERIGNVEATEALRRDRENREDRARLAT